MILLLSQAFAGPTIAGEHKTPRGTVEVAVGSPLDRVAFAVDGAESSHGTDEAMWRPDPAGPQGPMQVSKAAATDVGGGDRFDTAENRELGRAYLAQLYRRYGNWPDAIAAYNWGIGSFDAWLKAGRPATGVVVGVSAYLGRVLHDSGLCDGAPAKRAPRAPAAPVNCADLGAWADDLGGGRTPRTPRSEQFYSQLDKATRLAARHAGRRR
ncbi:MAG: lytic transglycosylase domain-containing protein [Stellaceae bacterium]